MNSPQAVIVFPQKQDAQLSLWSHLPLPLRAECEAVWRALRPRVAVEVFVPSRDFTGRPIRANRHADRLRREITRIIGGQTTARTDGEYCPPGGAPMHERTLVIRTFLPTVVSDGLRQWLVELVVEFGLDAHQEVVLVAVGAEGYWLHTRLVSLAPSSPGTAG